MHKLSIQYLLSICYIILRQDHCKPGTAWIGQVWSKQNHEQAARCVRKVLKSKTSGQDGKTLNNLGGGNCSIWKQLRLDLQRHYVHPPTQNQVLHFNTFYLGVKQSGRMRR